MLKFSEDVAVLVAATELVDAPEKWCKCASEQNGAYCMVGALSKTISGSATADILPLDGAMWRQLIRIIKHIESLVPGSSITFFNDHPTTTHADVMRVMHEAIATME